jgi:hypothetical protein
MTAGELARALLAYGPDRPVVARAAVHLAQGEIRVGAESTDGGWEGVEVLVEVGVEPDGLDDGIPF